MGLFSRYKASQIVNSMRKNEAAELEILSDVVLTMFISKIDAKCAKEFIGKLPKSFVTTSNTTILDEYLTQKYYLHDDNLDILRCILAHDEMYILKPHKYENFKMYFIADLDLPKNVRKVILSTPKNNNNNLNRVINIELPFSHEDNMENYYTDLMRASKENVGFKKYYSVANATMGENTAEDAYVDHITNNLNDL